MGAVDEAQLPEGEGDILLRVVGDTAHPAVHLRNGLHQQVGVVAPQVVEHHGDGGGKGVQPQLEVAGVTGCPSIFTCNVAVVTHGVALERFVTYVACLSGAEGTPVLSRHPYGLRIS